MATQADGLHVVEGAPADEKAAQSVAPKKSANKPKYAMPTNRVSIDKQWDIARAWAIASGPEGGATSNAKVANLVKIHADTVGLCSQFFLSAGVLVKIGRENAPTEATLAYAQAYQWDPDTARNRYADAFSESWFGKALLSRLDFQSMSEAEAIQVLGETNGVGKEYQTNIVMILDFLEGSQLIARENGQVRRNVGTSAPVTTAPTDPPASVQREQPKSNANANTNVATVFSQTPEGQIQFSVNFRVSMPEIAKWSPERISAFFAGVAQVLAAKSGVEGEATTSGP